MDGKKGHNDRELVEGCLQGRRESQQQLYKKYASKMFGVCLGYAKDRDDAKDILQEGFIKVFGSLKNYKGDGSLEGWVRRIIVNTAIDYYRKALKERNSVDIEDARDLPVEVSVLERMQASELLELVNRLPDGARLIFNLYVVEGYTHKEIAEMLQINQGTSKSQFARARALLQDLVAKLYRDPAAKTVEIVK
jgi:RNA polymerase sigma-70 factor (ECF subfamily)